MNIKKLINMKYVLVSFPEIQDFMLDRERFDKECIFVDDIRLPDSSYFVPESWYNELNKL